jgi:hypothetical protein
LSAEENVSVVVGFKVATCFKINGKRYLLLSKIMCTYTCGSINDMAFPHVSQRDVQLGNVGYRSSPPEQDPSWWREN